MLVVNSGNANAFTGKKRPRDRHGMTGEAAAKAAGCASGEVFLASTGVIGEPLDAGRFAHLLDGHGRQGAKPDAGRDAGKAIMTTDTYPKGRDRDGQARRRRRHHQRHRQGRRHDRARHGDDAVLRGDRRADRRAGAAGAAVAAATAKTFNAVTVDSDTSTSDTLLLFATGAAAKRGAQRIADPKDRAPRRLPQGR